MRPMVYVAGPISSNPMHGTHNACREAARLLDSGLVVPFIPHLTVLWDTVTPRDYEVWMAYDFAVIDRCQGVLRLDGHSPGADRETAYADKLGIPVFASVDSCIAHFQSESALHSDGSVPRESR